MSANRVLLALCQLLVTLHVAFGWHNPEMVDASFRLKLENMADWHQRQPAALRLRYNPAMRPAGMNLMLTLHGYSERNMTRISKLKTPFALLATAPVPESATGELDLVPLDLKCIVKEDECNKYDMGYVEIGLETQVKLAMNHTVAPNFFSQLIPLGWFLEKNFAKEDFKDWAYGKCRTWYRSEINATALQLALAKVSCPITMSVAMNDPGWYLKSSYLAGFPIEEWETGNFTAEPAQTCFYSAIENVTSDTHAAPASMCCYRNSDSMLLQKEFVSERKPLLHGSSVLRSHPGGSESHSEHYIQGQVPYLSHWYWDVLPYFYCCLWWEGDTCPRFYLKLRPAPRVHRKPVGSKAAFVTESHIHQLDGGAAPVFCPDPGEYWLVRSAAIEVQIRFYPVSSYKGGFPFPNSPPRHDFLVTGSKSAFVVGIAMRSMDTPHIVAELTCPEGDFRSFVQVTNRNTSTTVPIDSPMSLGLGRDLVVGDVVREPATMSKKYEFLVKHRDDRVGIIAYVVDMGEELMNLYLTISPGLLGSVQGLIKSGTCQEHRVTQATRLFGSSCDNCDDFEKFNSGQPVYFEGVPDLRNLPTHPKISCNNDPICKYVTFATMNPYYYAALKKSLKVGIEPFMKTLEYTDWEACQNPNTQLSGLYIGQDQSLNESATMKLKCIPPLSSNQSEGGTITCKRTGGSLAFDYPSDFKCSGGITEEAKQVEVKQEAAKASDEKYTKEHYIPEMASKASQALCKTVPPVAQVFLVSLALVGLFRLF